jgi:hypothetical protein
VRATFYVVFKAQVRRQWDARVSDYRDPVVQVKPDRMTLKPPDLRGGEIFVTYTTEIPDSAFVKMMPSVDVEIPDGWWTSMPVHVVVDEPPTEPEPDGGG